MKAKRILAMLLAVVMLLAMTPAVFADDAQPNKTVEIQYVFEGGKTAASSWTASLAAGSDYVGPVSNPTVVGYKADHMSLVENQMATFSENQINLNIKNIQNDIIITVTYVPAEVGYTVKYFQQNVDNDNYSLADTVSKTGYTGSKVNVDSQNYEGFYELLYDKDATIAADGSTVVEVYYDRNYYLMTFDLDGGYGVDPVYARYGAPVGEVGTPTRPGYTFTGWSTEIPQTVPVNGGRYTAQWQANDTAKVTVVFWGENANDEGYSYLNSKELYAQPGTEKTYTAGESSDLDSKLWKFVRADTVTVAADGSSVINVYYDRTEFTLTFKETGRWGDELATITDKWGANIVARFKQVCDENTYLWSEQSNGNSPWTSYLNVMPQQNRTYYAYTSTGDPESAQYIGEDLNGEYTVDLYTTSVRYYSYYGSGLSVSDEERVEIEGFTYDHGTANGEPYDGAKFYYKRNSYNLVFNDGYSDVRTESVKYQAALSSYNDYTPALPSAFEAGSRVFGGWYLNPECTGDPYVLTEHTMPANHVLLYAKWVPVSHTVKVYKDNTTTEPFNTQTVSHGNFADAPATPDNGKYTFVGWFYKDKGVEKAFDFASMPVTKDLDIYAKWSSNTLINYTINYKLEDGTVIADPTTGSALAGTTKTFDAKGGDQLYADYQEGYFPTTSSHSLTPDIDNSANNEYTFTYVQREAVPYTVKYLEQGTDVELATTKYVADNRKAVVTETAVSVSDYMPLVYQQRLIVTADGENVLIFYYVKDTQHAMVTETHILVRDGVETMYSHSEARGDIGTDYSYSHKTNIDGYVFDHATVNDTVWDKTGDPSAKLTGGGLNFVFYYKYNRFDVYYQSTQSKVTYDMAESFEVTDKVHSGYLYGGLYTDQTFATPRKDDICGLNFAPEAGATYYVKEVPVSYLQPKIFYVYDKNSTPANKLRKIYLVTAIDDRNYKEVGFIVNSDTSMSETVSETTVYEEVTVTQITSWATHATKTTKLPLSYFFKDSPETGLINIQKYSDYKLDPTNLDKDYTMLPYFVTPDGVKVTGTTVRTVKPGDGYVGTTGGLSVADSPVESTVAPYGNGGSTTAFSSLSLRSAYAINWDEPAATQYTITKVDGSETTTQTVEAGDQTGKITYTEKDGKLFAGWFTNSACTVPADFSDVQSDMTVYAKYVSASSIRTSVSLQNKRSGSLRTTVTLDSDQFAEVGFVYGYKDESKAVSAGNKTVKRSMFSWLFGNTQYQFTGDWNLSGLSSRDTFTVTPYWVTLDGTVVYGTADTYMYYLNLIIRK